MTVRLLAAYGQYPINAIVALDAGTEAGLVAAKLAVTNLTGGVAYVAPALPNQRYTGRVEYDGFGNFVGIVGPDGRRALVVSASAPDNADGRPDGTIYMQTGTGTFAKVAGVYVATGGGVGAIIIGTPTVGSTLTAKLPAGITGTLQFTRTLATTPFTKSNISGAVASSVNSLSYTVQLADVGYTVGVDCSNAVASTPSGAVPSAAPGVPIITAVASATRGANLTLSGAADTSAITGYTVIASPTGPTDLTPNSMRLNRSMQNVTPGVNYTYSAVGVLSAGGNTPTYNQLTSTATKYPLTRFNAAIAAATAGTPVIVATYGDSHTAGQGSGGGASGAEGGAATGLSRIFASKLNTTVLKTAVDSVWGDQNSSLSGTTYPLYDPRIALGSGWAIDTTRAPLGGRFIIGSASSAGTYDFTPAGTFDRVQIYYTSTTSSNQALAITLDGSTAVDTVNTRAASSTAFLKTAVYSVARGTHTVNLKATGASGNAYITGVVCWDSTAPCINMFQLGHCGATVSDLVKATQPYDSLNGLKYVAPALTIINCTTNDLTNLLDRASYKTQMTTIVQAAQISGDVILFGGFASNYSQATTGLLDDYMSVLREIGASLSVNVYDVREFLGTSYAAMQSSNYVFDTRHPNLAGHTLIGNAYAAAVTA